MNKIYGGLLALLIPLISGCPVDHTGGNSMNPDLHHRIKMIEMYESDPSKAADPFRLRERWTASYNDRNEVSRIESLYISDDGKESYEQDRFMWEEKNIIGKEHYRLNGSDWNLWTKYDYAFNDSGQPINRWEYEVSGATPWRNRETVYEYSQAPSYSYEKEYTLYQFDAQPKQLQFERTLQIWFDENNRKIKNIAFKQEGENQVPYRKEEQTYGPWGSTRLIHFEIDSGAWKTTSDYTIEYNSSGYMVSLSEGKDTAEYSFTCEDGRPVSVLVTANGKPWRRFDIYWESKEQAESAEAYFREIGTSPLYGIF